MVGPDAFQRASVAVRGCAGACERASCCGCCKFDVRSATAAFRIVANHLEMLSQRPACRLHHDIAAFLAAMVVVCALWSPATRRVSRTSRPVPESITCSTSATRRGGPVPHRRCGGGRLRQRRVDRSVRHTPQRAPALVPQPGERHVSGHRRDGRIHVQPSGQRRGLGRHRERR